MHTRKQFGCFVLALTLTIVFQSSGSAQSLAAQEERYSAVIEKKGWKVPDISGLKIVNKEQIEVDGYVVWRSWFKLEDTIPFITLKNREMCELRWLSTYVTAGEVFAIGGDCVKFGIDPRYGKFYYGGVSNYSFFDEDGDGKFETRVTAGRPMLFVPKRLQKSDNRVPRQPEIPPPPSPRLKPA